MPLYRVPAGGNAGHSWASRHTGSIVDLVPATAYQIELQLTDPDGGSASRTVETRTRAVPTVSPAATVRTATPSTLASVRSAARPGDVVQLGPGSYPGFTWDRDGTADNPIVLRGGDGAAIEGELSLFSRKHVHLDSLTVNGRVRFNGSESVSITRSTVRAKANVGHR